MMTPSDKANVEPDIVLHMSGWDHLQVPPPSQANYAITGNESQVITLKLPPGETCKGEPGSMMYLSSGINQTISCDGCCARCCSGESCFVLNFTNGGGQGHEYAALSPSFPTSKVIPVNMSSPEVGGTLICQQGSYMASYGDVEVGISLDCSFLRCCCGGMGLIRQKLEGSGTVFLESTGTIVQKVLAPDEVIIVDTNTILAYAGTCKLDLRRAGGILGMMGGGEGIFNTTVTGPGLVIVASMNQTVFMQSLAAQKLWRR